MGINNRNRRRAKKAKRLAADRTAGAQAHELDDLELRRAVLAAAKAPLWVRPGPPGWRLDELRLLEERAGRDAVGRAVTWCVEHGLDRVWASGWQPADVARVARKLLSPAHGDALRPVLVDSAARRPESATDERWAAQVAAMGRQDAGPRHGPPWARLDQAVEIVSLLLHLPPLPPISSSGARGAARRSGGSSAMLERVRALLAKAESTTFPEEAEALTAKAQELMARHAIDEAMLDAGDDGGPVDVVGWRIGVDDPYAHAKSVLLHCIAEANRCRSVWNKAFGFSTVFGARSDLEIVELLFTSLLVQGTDAMLRAGRSADGAGRSRTRSFRQSFLLAYAHRIGERLAATTEEVLADEFERRGEALLPVLASRSEAVDEAVRAAYPHLVHRDTTISNWAGWAAGRMAADLASLRVGDELRAG